MNKIIVLILIVILSGLIPEFGYSELTADRSYNFQNQNIRLLDEFPFKIGEESVYKVEMMGVYVGDQHYQFIGYTNYFGKKALAVRSEVQSTEGFSSFYKINDRDVSIFYPENLEPVRYEKFINEGNWHDHMIYFFRNEEGYIELNQKVSNYQTQNIETNLIARDYLSMIMLLRCVDYDYYIQNNQEFELNYVLGTEVQTVYFQPVMKSVDFNETRVEVIALKEINGYGIEFLILNNSSRTPLHLSVPAYKVPGFKKININAQLTEKKEGHTEISETP